MIRQSWKLFKRAFSENKKNYKYLLVILVLEGLIITGLYHLNKQYGFLYQGIQDYNHDLIWKSIITFASIAGVLVFVGGYATFFLNKLAFGIRDGLTQHYTKYIEYFKHIENVEQRIQEDVRNFGRLSVDFWITVLKASVKLPLFLGVIITLTSWYVGVIILIAVVLGTYLTKLLSLKLVKLQAAQETNEANFRKSIGTTDLYQKWLSIKHLFSQINVQLKKLTFLQSGLSQAFVLLPFIILLPLYISKAVTMGAFFQSVNALSKVIDSLTVLIDNRQLIADMVTCLTRMETLECTK
jgi:putative ATP-binding cassette transporter